MICLLLSPLLPLSDLIFLFLVHLIIQYHNLPSLTWSNLTLYCFIIWHAFLCLHRLDCAPHEHKFVFSSICQYDCCNPSRFCYIFLHLSHPGNSYAKMGVPTSAPTHTPTMTPTSSPTEIPTASPTATPTHAPTDIPTAVPTAVPTAIPTADPTATPTYSPTHVSTSHEWFHQW